MRKGKAVMAVNFCLVKPLRRTGRIAEPDAQPANHAITIPLALLIRNQKIPVLGIGKAFAARIGGRRAWNLARRDRGGGRRRDAANPRPIQIGAPAARASARERR
jgi:hypothetical protein